MPLRSYIKAKFTVSHDNNANPQQVAFSSGDVEVTDSTSYNEESSKTLRLPPTTVDHDVDMSLLAVAAVTFIKSDIAGVTVKLAAPGQDIADALPLTLKPGHPMIVPCDLEAIQLSNPSTTDSAIVQIASVGN